MNKLMLSVVFVFALAAQSSNAATWGVKELLASSEEATDYFKSKMGSTLYNNITGVATELNAQKIAAKAKLTYKDEQNKVKVAEYFCHEHEAGVIDCH